MERRDKPSSEWLQKAACKPKDQILFFGKRLTAEQITERNDLCNGCEVKQNCLDDAMYYGDVVTFRAGKTPDELQQEWERRGLRREKKKKMK